MNDLLFIKRFHTFLGARLIQYSNTSSNSGIHSLKVEWDGAIGDIDDEVVN